MIRIVAPHFIAGIVIGDRAAPIVRYMERWTYCAGRGWHADWV